MKVKVLGKELDALLDSGAAISIISDPKILARHNFKIRPTELRIRTADETEHPGIGMLHIPYTFQGTTKVIPTLYVPQIAKQLILGIDFWNHFGIKPAISNNAEWKPLTINSTELDLIALNTATDYFAENFEDINLILEPTGEKLMDRENNEDDSLEIPSVERPIDGDIENIDTEHELTEHERF